MFLKLLTIIIIKPITNYISHVSSGCALEFNAIQHELQVIYPIQSALVHCINEIIHVAHLFFEAILSKKNQNLGLTIKNDS